MAQWSRGRKGVLELPSGRTLRGRASRDLIDDEPADLTLRLCAFAPRSTGPDTVWIRWPDFGLPAHPRAAIAAMHDAWIRSETERVDVCCRGGRGRTGTTLACIAVIDGMHADAAIDLVRRVHHRRAVETPRQARFVRSLSAALGGP